MADAIISRKGGGMKLPVNSFVYKSEFDIGYDGETPAFAKFSMNTPNQTELETSTSASSSNKSDYDHPFVARLSETLFLSFGGKYSYATFVFLRLDKDTDSLTVEKEIYFSDIYSSYNNMSGYAAMNHMWKIDETHFAHIVTFNSSIYAFVLNIDAENLTISVTSSVNLSSWSYSYATGINSFVQNGNMAYFAFVSGSSTMQAYIGKVSIDSNNYEITYSRVLIRNIGGSYYRVELFDAENGYLGIVVNTSSSTHIYAYDTATDTVGNYKTLPYYGNNSTWLFFIGKRPFVKDLISSNTYGVYELFISNDGTPSYKSTELGDVYLPIQLVFDDEFTYSFSPAGGAIGNVIGTDLFIKDDSFPTTVHSSDSCRCYHCEDLEKAIYSLDYYFSSNQYRYYGVINCKSIKKLNGAKSSTPDGIIADKNKIILVKL